MSRDTKGAVREDGWRLEAGAATDTLLADALMEWPWRTDEGAVYGAIPRYSASIGAAWEVVERLRSLAWCTTVRADCYHDGEPAGYHVEVMTCLKDGHQIRTFEATADTAPLAICRAAMFVVAQLKIDATPTASQPNPSAGEQR